MILFTRCDFFWVWLHFLIKLQSYSVNSIIDMYATCSMRCIKMHSHSEKIAPCEWPLNGFHTYSVRLWCAILVNVMCTPIYKHSKLHSYPIAPCEQNTPNPPEFFLKNAVAFRKNRTVWTSLNTWKRFFRLWMDSVTQKVQCVEQSW